MSLPGKTAARARVAEAVDRLAARRPRSWFCSRSSRSPCRFAPEPGTSFALTDTPFSGTPDVSLYAHTARIVSPSTWLPFMLTGPTSVPRNFFASSAVKNGHPARGPRSTLPTIGSSVLVAPPDAAGRRRAARCSRARRRRAAVVTAGRERERRRRHEGEQREAEALRHGVRGYWRADGAEQSPPRCAGQLAEPPIATCAASRTESLTAVVPP